MVFTVGVDVGNYDTKSQNTVTPSGYTVYKNKPMMSNETLAYNGSYYVPSVSERLPYVMDKTQNEQALILTLFGIAKEIVYSLMHNPNYKNITCSEMQAEINRIESINLGVGLPPGHLDTLMETTKNYYMETMGDGISFSYKNTSLSDELYFTFNLKECGVYPQDYSAVLLNKDVTISQEFDNYVIIGIGGYTVDVVQVIDRQPVVKECKSLNLGTRPMYEDIIARVQSTTGKTLSERGVEDVLLGRKHILSDEVVNVIHQVTKTHAELIINRCNQAGVDFSENPIIFFGGGCILLKGYLENNPLIAKCEFITDTKCNAQHYARFVKASANK